MTAIGSTSRHPGVAPTSSPPPASRLRRCSAALDVEAMVRQRAHGTAGAECTSALTSEDDALDALVGSTLVERRPQRPHHPERERVECLWARQRDKRERAACLAAHVLLLGGGFGAHVGREDE